MNCCPARGWEDISEIANSGFPTHRHGCRLTCQLFPRCQSVQLTPAIATVDGFQCQWQSISQLSAGLGLDRPDIQPVRPGCLLLQSVTASAYVAAAADFHDVGQANCVLRTCPAVESRHPAGLYIIPGERRTRTLFPTRLTSSQVNTSTLSRATSGAYATCFRHSPSSLTTSSACARKSASRTRS